MIYSLPSFLLYFISFLYSSVYSFTCMQCGGEKYNDDVNDHLRMSLSSCCTPSPIQCNHGFVCIRASVRSPTAQFILSGCHPPEDGLIGCDTHSLPNNASVHRCICLDLKCQSYFPSDCSSSTYPSTTTRRRLNDDELPLRTKNRHNSHKRMEDIRISDRRGNITQTTQKSRIREDRGGRVHNNNNNNNTLPPISSISFSTVSYAFSLLLVALL